MPARGHQGFGRRRTDGQVIVGEGPAMLLHRMPQRPDAARPHAVQLQDRCHRHAIEFVQIGVSSVFEGAHRRPGHRRKLNHGADPTGDLRKICPTMPVDCGKVTTSFRGTTAQQEGHRRPQKEWHRRPGGTMTTISTHADSPWLTELARRAEAAVEAYAISVDYYRIRRRLAWPRPVTALPTEAGVALDFTGYPWSIWFCWTWEDRLYALSAVADSDDRARATLREDLGAMLGWPRFHQLSRPDLALGHLGRMLADPQLTSHADPQALTAAQHRLVEQGLALVRDHRAASEQALQQDPTDWDLTTAKRVIANIPIIGTLGTLLAARAADHPDTDELEAYAAALVRARAARHRTGLSETVAYDGYVASFLFPTASSGHLNAHAKLELDPVWTSLQESSLWLGVPGNPALVAPLGDCEPVQMPHHFEAVSHAVRHGLPTPAGAAEALGTLPARALTTRTLLDLVGADVRPAESQALPHGHRQLASTAVLSTGRGADDVTVAVSTPRDGFSHIVGDAGSIVVGSRGRWLVDDPGYQQYLATSEREFTTGVRAHNAPVVNGQHAAGVPGEVTVTDGRITIDLTPAYSSTPGRVTREITLSASGQVEVTDRCDAAAELSWTWHGHPGAAWSFGEQVGLHEPVGLHFGSEERGCCGTPTAPCCGGDDWHLTVTGLTAAIEPGWQHRLRGSRGQQSLCTPTFSLPAGAAVTWTFARLDRTPRSV
ncbi:hypothetical protein CGZ91_12095 [Parenemella sanctibonifatiensis]|uniref:Heparinase II/III-like C-terminal domain-containing protein n=2 Tax=Parenemella sanctibonifatiensis TaxID=2016505 RepID=A0A255EBR5_9ACTN|nr:hypothetical protein CGZ91_12095 [Parenemella sanctibonifatiensis]